MKKTSAGERTSDSQSASRSVTRLLLLLAAAALTACGGGGGSDGGGSTPTPQTYTLSGRVQKGPFATGSAIAVNETSASLNPMGKVYNVQTSNALGDFTVSTPIGTPQVEIVANGFYLDELSGQLSTSQITLRAFADLTVNASPTVNVLTTLQGPRLKTLVSQGSTFAQAQAQSAREILAVFGIDSTRVNALAPLSAMRIDGSSDSDAVLLSVSVTLSQMALDSSTANGTSRAAELSNLVNSLAADLSSAGTVTSPTFVSARNVAQTEVDVAGVTSKLQTYYANNGLTISPPPFREWLDPSGSGSLPQRQVAVAGLSFTDSTAATPGQLVTSNAVTIAGLAAGVVVPVSVSAGTTLVKNGAAVGGSLATLTNGDSIALRVTAPGFGSVFQSTLSAGASSAVWKVTSRSLGGAVAGLTGTGLVLQNNGAGDIAIAPGETTFSFAAELANGDGYDITVLSDPTGPPQVCTVSNGKGTVGTTQSSITVACNVATDEIFITDVQGSVMGYFVDPDTGRVGAPTAPRALGTSFTTADPSGRFLYGSSGFLQQNDSGIKGYSISPTTGDLISISGTPFSAGPAPAYGMTVDPSGKYLYAARNSTNALAYEIDALTGALAPIAGSPFAALNPSFAWTDFMGAGAGFLYYSQFTGGGTARIDGFKIDATTGALTSVGSVLSTQNVNNAVFAVHPVHGFVYVADGNVISAYAGDPSTGALTSRSDTLLGPSDAPMDAGSIATNPAGTRVYVPSASFSANSGAVFGYAIDAGTGALTALAGSPFSSSLKHEKVRTNSPFTFDRTGKFFYALGVAVENGVAKYAIAAFAIDPSTGALTEVSGSPFRLASGNNPRSVVLMRIP